ncbi:calpain-B-like [Aphidius gifuensis]|uniref:calpain-B-like n=1 Tax=Aphidius gifuensis TaxID=684658 RepID=UPI001CDBDA62|nr:calpain-B-like [Aphidius gifuensis]
MISCATLDEEKFKKFGTRVFSLHPRHGYAVTSVKIVKGDKAGIIGEFRLIRIRDPYGEAAVDLYHGNIKYLFTEATLKSKLDTQIIGESWILYDDFIKYFSYIDICNLTPNQIIGHVYSSSGKKLALSAIEGKFMGAVTTKQKASNDFFTVNPQYRMVLKKSDGVLIGVSLKRRHDLQRAFNVIYFRIMSFDDKDTSKLPKPLLTSSIGAHSFGIFTFKGQVGQRIDLEPGTYYIIPYIIDSFKGATFYLQVLSKQQDILEVYDRDIHMPHITEKLKYLLTKNTHLHEDDHVIFSQIASDLTINFKGLYNILKNDKLSLNENCHVPQELDDTVVLELELLATKKLVPQRKLSHLTIAKTLLITQEVFEIYGEKDCPGYIKNVYILTVLKRNGYFINMNIFNAIYALFPNRDILIHFNDYILIVFAIKNKFGSYCEEFHAKLCKDLVLMVHDDTTTFNDFNEPQIHELRINEQQFNVIIKFIKNLKEIFHSHASKPYFSVAFAKLKDLFDAFDYKLTYNIIATIFQSHGNDVDIFYNQFVQKNTKIYIK